MATVTSFGTGGSAGANVTTVSASGSASAGDLLVVCCGMLDPTAVTSAMVTDAAGNTYTLLGNTSNRWNTASNRAAVWYSVLTNPLAAAAVTYNPGVAATGMGIWVVRVQTPSASPADYSGGQANLTTTPYNGTTGGTGTGTLGQADEVGVFMFCWKNAATFTPPAGWSQFATTTINLSDPGETDTMAVAWLETAATTALNPSCSLSASQPAMTATAMFKVSGGAGPTGPPAGSLAALGVGV